MADEKPEGEQASTLSEDELLEKKLAAFDEKVKKAGGKKMPDVPEWSYERPKVEPPKQSTVGGVAFGLSLLYTLLAPVIGGFVIGLIVDKARHTEGAAGIGTAIGMVCGFVALIVVAKNQMNKDDKK